MSLRSYIMPYMAATISSPLLKQAKRQLIELKRRLLHQPHNIQVFLKLDDPYSFLLVQVLEDIAKRFQVNIQCYTVLSLPEEMFPEHQLWNQNAIKDAQWLASLYGLNYPTEQQLTALEEKKINPYLSALLHAENSSNNLHEMKEIFFTYWMDKELFNENITTETNLDSGLATQLKLNEHRLHQLGHYFSAMIYYAGEWYWGLDRLDHLEKRLNDLNLSTSQPPEIHFDKTWNTPKTSKSSTTTAHALEIFFSARSPYSYLGLERAAELCRRLNIDLIIKPVLPMVMRGMTVPDAKKMYIFLDTKREAEKLGIPYGKVADPLGAGVERCYALFNYAQSEGKALDYLLSYARRVNAQGVRSETDCGLKEIVEGAGLSWYTARHFLEDDSWRVWAQENVDDMLSAGQWGVPAFRYGKLMVWGQDRLYQIEQEVLGYSAPSND